MTFVVQTFRDSYPEFQDITKYPDFLITQWASVATAMVNCARWKSQTLLGISLYTAHEITIAWQNSNAANVGGTPGQQSGPANSKTVGTVTAAFDTQQVAEKDAGYWNLTTYGKQFIRLARIFGSGAVQV